MRAVGSDDPTALKEGGDDLNPLLSLKMKLT